MPPTPKNLPSSPKRKRSREADATRTDRFYTAEQCRAHVLSFIEADSVGSALIRSKHNIDAHVRKLKLLSQSPDERVSLAALKQLSDLILTSARLSGLVEKQTVTVPGPSGAIASSTRLQARLETPPPTQHSSPSAITILPRIQALPSEAPHPQETTHVPRTDDLL